MALSEQMESALNDQITCELSACLAYLQMSAHFEEDDRPGMASWMSTQSDEEASHARMFIDFLLSRGGRVEIGTIPAPLNKFDSPLHVFEEALRHEEMVTERIRDLYRLATELDDLESLPFLHGFLSEQVEEEDLVSGICERIRRIEGSEVGLALIESELSGRDPEEH
ncbi:MAG: ferritin [Acidimicrobiia bacterium]|nr:ferritin [Acidimicrobiia bacterium]MXZ06517.1 ferritin [Acidimicrobiia bacterium]MYD04364.1 ferritin [Acidimicrobiia bacterium]